MPPSPPCPQNRLGSEKLVILLTCLLPAAPKICLIGSDLHHPLEVLKSLLQIMGFCFSFTIWINFL